MKTVIFLLSLVGEAFNERLAEGNKLKTTDDVVRKLNEPYELKPAEDVAGIRADDEVLDPDIYFDEDYERTTREGRTPRRTGTT